MILPGRVAASSHRSHRSVLSALAPLVRHLAKGSHPSANDASMFTGASSELKVGRPKTSRAGCGAT